MKAAVSREYGPPDVVHIEEVRTPIPADDEVLIRVRAASVNLGDWELLTAHPLHLTVIAMLFVRRPRHDVVSSSRPDSSSRTGRRLFTPKFNVLGSDVAGRVEALGRNVTRFRPGDEVFGDCGMNGFGAFAEYVCLPETAPLAPKPAGMSYEQAAAIPQASFIALQALRDRARVQPGRKVLINGAGGGAGTCAVQIAKAFGAEVTGVDAPGKLEMLRLIGADHVSDYTREDYTKSGQQYDVILDLAAHRTVFESRRALTTDGIYLMAGGSWTALWQSLLLGPLISTRGKGSVRLLAAAPSRENLVFMTELFEAGKFVPVIDGCFPLRETAAALRRVGQKESRGKVVITP